MHAFLLVVDVFRAVVRVDRRAEQRRIDQVIPVERQPREIERDLFPEVRPHLHERLRPRPQVARAAPALEHVRLTEEGRAGPRRLGPPKEDPPLLEPVGRRHLAVVRVVERDERLHEAPFLQDREVEDLVHNTLREVQPVLGQEERPAPHGRVLLVQVPFPRRRVVGRVGRIGVVARDTIGNSFERVHAPTPVSRRGLRVREHRDVGRPAAPLGVQLLQRLLGLFSVQDRRVFDDLVVDGPSANAIRARRPSPERRPRVDLVLELELVVERVRLPL